MTTPRTTSLNIRFTPAERAALQRAADAAQRRVSDYVRLAAIRQAEIDRATGGSDAETRE